VRHVVVWRGERHGMTGLLCYSPTRAKVDPRVKHRNSEENTQNSKC
jgi:hypothetical protein